MPVRTRRWDDPVEPGDGLRLLVTRYRPRGLPKEAETWQVWQPNLGPSKALHAAAYGKAGLKFNWDDYRRRYLAEMRLQASLIHEWAERVAAGETITLLCSSACVRESRCHRLLLRDLMEREAERIIADRSGIMRPPGPG